MAVSVWHHILMKGQKDLASQRLLIRKIRPADRGFICGMLGDQRVREYLGGVVPVDKQEQAMKSLLSELGDEMTWLVEEQTGQEKLGLVYLSKHCEEDCFELSYQFASNAWGKGYAAEACKCVLDFAFQELKQDRVVAETQAKNSASCRLLDRLGMTELRRLQRYDAEQVIFVIKPTYS